MESAPEVSLLSRPMEQMGSIGGILWLRRNPVPLPSGA